MMYRVMLPATLGGEIVAYTRFGRVYRAIQSAVRALRGKRNAYVIDDHNTIVAHTIFDGRRYKLVLLEKVS
jgi:hypothetical protein